MVHFVQLTHRKGEPIWINPEQVISVAPVYDDRSGETGSAVTTNRGTIVTTQLCGDVIDKLSGLGVRHG